jgi:hypothetical protein
VKHPLFCQAGCCPVRLEVGAVDHQPFRHAGLRHQGVEDAVEHAEPAPADEAIIDGVTGRPAGLSVSAGRLESDGVFTGVR